MAFSKEQLKTIRREVGGLCERRVPEHFRDQVRLVYAIEGYNVYIRETRPGILDLSKWTNLDIAKLRYTKASDEWRLYWKRASGKWWRYEPSTRAVSLTAMVREIEADGFGCFFG
jgi:hypothetical protein